MTALYPLCFSPVFKAYPWGGRALEERLGRSIPDGIVAESWEVSAHADGPTRVAGGALDGLTLAEVLERFGVDLVGRNNLAAVERGRFPLLVKLLDANSWLSVQVHPDDSYALEHHSDLGKSEMWIVLDAQPGAELVLGFAERESPESVASAVTQKRLLERLHRVPAVTGDVFAVPPGSIHALGPGLLIAEIQQSSNVTFRLYDWDRQGSERPLHVEESLAVLDYDLVRPGPVAATDPAPGWQPLWSSPHFITEAVTMAAGETLEGSCQGETLEIWGALEGKASLEWSGGRQPLAAVQWCLLPAVLGDYSVVAGERSRLVRVTTPPAT